MRFFVRYDEHYEATKPKEFDKWSFIFLKNIGKDITVKDISNVQVQIEFIVDENGSVSKAKIFKSSGIKEIDQDALRVISESPEWNSAIMYNNPVKAYRVQPFTYSIETEKKSK